MAIEIESPLGGKERQLGVPVKAVGEEDPVPRRAPRLGEHNDEILEGLGFSSERIEDFRSKGVIRRK
jgi:formyl-CoA transferase